MPIYAVYPSRKHLSAKVRLFVDFLLERFAARRTGAQPEDSVRSLLLQVSLCQAAAPEWLIATDQPRPGRRQALRDHRGGHGQGAAPGRDRGAAAHRDRAAHPRLRARGPAENGRRSYAGDLPASMSGSVQVDLVGRDSSVLQLAVAQRRTGAAGHRAARPRRVRAAALGERSDVFRGRRRTTAGRRASSSRSSIACSTSARGFGREQPWLSGFYFGYTQNSIWDLSSESKPFRDTSYRPSFFWKWERTDDATCVDGVRFGLEHESNGGDGANSRSINTVFVRPGVALDRFADRHEHRSSRPSSTTTWKKTRTPTSSSTAAMSTGAALRRGRRMDRYR